MVIAIMISLIIVVFVGALWSMMYVSPEEKRQEDLEQIEWIKENCHPKAVKEKVKTK